MVAPNKRSKKTAQLVLAAIGDMGAANGSTSEQIQDFISKEYSVPEQDFKRYLTKALERGVAFGAIRKIRGKYTLGGVLDDFVTMKRTRRSRSKSGRRTRKPAIKRKRSRRRKRGTV